MALICKTFSPLHPRMLCTKFGWNWPSGSQEEEKNVISLWKTDGQGTTGDQNGSLEFSAQVSSKRLEYHIKSVYMTLKKKNSRGYRISTLLSKNSWIFFFTQRQAVCLSYLIFGGYKALFESLCSDSCLSMALMAKAKPSPSWSSVYGWLRGGTWMKAQRDLSMDSDT